MHVDSSQEHRALMAALPQPASRTGRGKARLRPSAVGGWPGPWAAAGHPELTLGLWRSLMITAHGPCVSTGPCHRAQARAQNPEPLLLLSDEQR